MIRKPSEAEFQDSGVVTALRESRKIAVEGGKGVARGIFKVYWIYLVGIFGFGFVVSALGQGLRGLLVLAGLAVAMLVVYLVRRGGRSAEAFDVSAPASFARLPAGLPARSGRYELDIATLARQAAILAVLGGGLLFFARVGFAPRTFTVCGLALVVVAVLHLVRLFGDRTAVKFDGQGITVKGLFGEKFLRWTDVDRIEGRRSWLGGALRLSARSLAITASPARSDGPAELLVPIDLINLDDERLAELISSLMYCRASADRSSPDQSRDALWSSEFGVGTVQDAEPEPAFARSGFGTRGLSEPHAPRLSRRPSLQPDALRQVKPFGRRTSAS
uniref:Low molecular weight protein antigen 6 PH domain-containing protein n=1 Tax=Rhodopseudomonas palustris (strain BisA53) TaxID=316055 RepID=Q07M38_RHOP5